jgi:hypothetical protein
MLCSPDINDEGPAGYRMWRLEENRDASATMRGSERTGSGRPFVRGSLVDEVLTEVPAHRSDQ